MAEFCLDCRNRINETNDEAEKYIISKELGLCEGCAEMKHVVAAERKNYYWRKFRFIFFPFRVLFIIVYTLWRLMILPYLLYKDKKDANNG